MDCDSLFQIDCSEERKEFLDGKDIQEKIKSKAIQLCQALIGGQWDHADQSDLVFEPVKGGLSNCLFKCSLKSKNQVKHENSSKVLIRIYGNWHDEEEQTDSLITLLLGERNLGPKLLGVFPGGRIEEFIESSTMIHEDLFNDLYIKGVARTLAAINCLEVPINRKSNWLIGKLNYFNNKLKKELDIEKVDQNHKEIAQEFLAADFSSEIEWIKKHVINKVKSPIVFCNNDVFPPNVLIRNEVLGQIKRLNQIEDCQLIEKLIDQLIVIIDFEFCSYNFRGSEIGNYFMAHMIEYNTPEPPYFLADRNKYPDEKHQRLFIREYLNKLKQIKGNLDDSVDNEDHIMQEAEAYQMPHILLWTLLNVCYANMSMLSNQFTFDFWQLTKQTYNDYKIMKNDYIIKYKIKD